MIGHLGASRHQHERAVAGIGHGSAAGSWSIPATRNAEDCRRLGESGDGGGGGGAGCLVIRSNDPLPVMGTFRPSDGGLQRLSLLLQ